jgi:adenine phosphoribosyltransferase
MPVDLAARVRTVADHPLPGVSFKDLTPLLADASALGEAVARLAAWAAPRQPDVVVAPEAWGFVTGGGLARELGCGFVAARKPGNLPRPSLRADYALEYGADSVELHRDAVRPGERVLVHDNVLATGGTAGAACRLVERLAGTVVGCAFVAEIVALGGRARLAPYDVFALIQE